MIYFMRLGFTGDSPIKIGFAANVKARRQVIANRRGCHVDVLGVLPGGRSEEAELHARFKGDRLGRPEHFRPSDELLEFIKAETTPLEAVPIDNDATAKIDADVLRKAKHIALFDGKTLAEYLTEIIEPVVDKRLRQMAGEMIDKPKV